MVDKMQRFVDIGARMPDKREAQARRADFAEIYDAYSLGRAAEQAGGLPHVGVVGRQCHAAGGGVRLDGKRPAAAQECANAGARHPINTVNSPFEIVFGGPTSTT